MRIFFIIIVLILWGLLGWLGCKVQEECLHCNNELVAVTEPEPTKDVVSPLLFAWDSDQAITSDKWALYRDSIVGNLGPDEKLQITGYYRADEQNATSYDNLGLARAEKTKELFLTSNSLDADRILTRAELTSDPIENQSVPFVSTGFGRYINENITQGPGNAPYQIRFPYNSTSKLDNANVNKFLKDLADRMSGNPNMKLEITGHTDNKGRDDYNTELGLKRAKLVANTLVNFGVKESRMTVATQGESSPIASNDTEDGRAENRRVEILIIE